MNDLQKIDPKVVKLLEDLGSSRDKLHNYISDLETLRKSIDALFPAKADFRNKFALEEKIKASTSFYSTILSMWQEVNKTIVSEVEIRRKISGEDDDKEIDIRPYIDQLETHFQEKKKQQLLEPQADSVKDLPILPTEQNEESNKELLGVLNNSSIESIEQGVENNGGQ